MVGALGLRASFASAACAVAGRGRPPQAAAHRLALRWYGRSSQDRPPPQPELPGVGLYQAPAVLAQLVAELSATGKPDRSMAQVNRQLSGAEVPVLGQAAADRGLRNQHRQAQLGRLLAWVGAPAPLASAD
jgi:hypothetical protein